jgi:excisionase family DNA binding protein
VSNVVPFDPAARRARPARPHAGAGPAVLTVKQTAHLLGLSLNTTYAYLADGSLPFGKRVGRRWIIPRARLDAWLAGQTEEGE